MTHCDFQIQNETWICTKCKFTVAQNTNGHRPIRNCTPSEVTFKRGELGTKVKGLLNRIGITQERYLDAIESLGMPRTCLCPEREAWLNQASVWWAKEQNIELRVGWTSVKDLSRDTLSLIPKLDPDIDCVIGVARSGMMPASILSMMLHVPLFSINQWSGEIQNTGHGHRLGQVSRFKKPLIIDDTVGTGTSMAKVRSHKIENAKYAAVYCTTRNLSNLDYVAFAMDEPHWLEWNFFNAPSGVFLDKSAFDFDGIFCYDCQPHEDDGGKLYRKFAKSAKPKYLVRQCEVQAIISARLPMIRSHTMQWLKRHGLRVKKLMLWPYNAKERSLERVTDWKCEQFEKSKLVYFVESDPAIAAGMEMSFPNRIICPSP